MARTAKQKAALRKAQRVSAQKRRRRGRGRKIAIGVAAAGAVGVGSYYAHKHRKTIKKHAGPALRRAKPVAKHVGRMVGSPAGAIAHAKAVRGVMQGKKSGLNFLLSSHNWEKAKKQAGGRRMYTVA